MDAQLITRLIVSILAIINLICQQMGWTPFEADEEKLYSAVSLVITIIVWVRGFWKNNNFTEAAKLGQTVTDQIKLQQKIEKLQYTTEELEKFNDNITNQNKEG